MYAVIVAGGKQQRVAVDDVIRVEKIESADGHVEFDKVLAVADGANVKLGAPYVDGGKVTAEILKQGRADKVTITKFRQWLIRRLAVHHATDVIPKASASELSASAVRL